MQNYNIGEVWWVHFPFGEKFDEKRRPAIIIDDETIAILAMYVTSKNKNHPYSIRIDDWESAGLKKQSWTRIDKIVRIDEWDMERKIGDLSERDRTKIFQLVAEIMTKKLHEFSLAAIRNSKGEYLQKYDVRWKCWLFPYVRSAAENKENVNTYISELLNTKMDMAYVTRATHCKYSVSDEVYKIYDHKLYGAVLDPLPSYMATKTFSINGADYKWMSIGEMEEDDEIMEKNDDIVAFVRAKCV